MANSLITGISSGLGLGFVEALLAQGDTVFGVSRRGAPIRHPRLIEIWADLTTPDIDEELAALLHGVEHLDLVVLNAGIFGELKPLADTEINALEQVMDTNVWACKRVLDHLIRRKISARTVLLISSGAAVRGSFGWGAYAISKAALNMLTQLYAHEMPQSKLLAVAPGLVDTAMQDYLCGEVDETRFPSVNKLRTARGTDDMRDGDAVAATIVARIETLRASESGAFVDIRNLD